MKLYHGTNESSAKLSIKEGIRPRGTTKGNWDNNPSHPELVYLTKCYAPYFAMVASGDNEQWGVLEIDIEKLDENKLRPDEDFLEQLSRDRRGLDALSLKRNELPFNLEERTLWFRDRVDLFSGLWKASVDFFGQLRVSWYNLRASNYAGNIVRPFFK